MPDQHPTEELKKNSVTYILGQLTEQIKNLTDKVKELNDGTYSRIISLENTKADRAITDRLQKILDDDVEVRLRAVEECMITKVEKSGVETRINDLETSKKWIWLIVAGYIIIASTVIGYGITRIDDNYNLLTQHIEQTK